MKIGQKDEWMKEEEKEEDEVIKIDRTDPSHSVVKDERIRWLTREREKVSDQL